MSESCSMEPDSRRSDNMGRLVALSSTFLLNCESTIIGIFNSFASCFSPFDNSVTSFSRVRPPYSRCSSVAYNQQPLHGSRTFEPSLRSLLRRLGKLIPAVSSIYNGILLTLLMPSIADSKNLPRRSLCTM